MNTFTEALPDPKGKEKNSLDPEIVLQKLMDEIGSKYDGRILGYFSSTSEGFDPNMENRLSYNFSLIFPNRDGYIYPLFTATCKLSNGSYPLDVTSHYSPPIPRGEVKSREEFEKVIEVILKDDKTRFIILSLY